MATNENGSKNEQFLKKLEQQRLNKLCNRVIDLRGKVSGECQAYTFGGKTHYLDDRAYLLAKQLLARFKGKYTIAVYESVLKIVKTLNEQQSNTESQPIRKDKGILFNDPHQPQLIAFDQLVRRQEPRILFATPVKITIDDMLYHGSTIDISTSAIRVSLKRSYTLEQGAQIYVDFPDFNTDSLSNLLTNIPYRIINIKHTESHTVTVLVRSHSDNLAVSEWLDNWTQQHHKPAYLDLDNELINLASYHYLRLYTQTLNNALLWLGDEKNSNPIKAFHLMPRAEHVLSALIDNAGDVDLNRLPINTSIATSSDMIVAIANIHNAPQSIAVARHERLLVAKLLNWSQANNSTVLLVKIHKQHINPLNFANQIDAISIRDREYSVDLAERLSDIKHCVTITDISTSCRHTEAVAEFTEAELAVATVTEQGLSATPVPTPLTHYFIYHEPRFYIRTAITIHVNGKQFKLTSIDASATGLSFSPPDDLVLRKDMPVLVDFERWQAQTKKVSLTQIPYIVRNTYRIFKQVSVGLERDTLRCSKQTNSFFADIIEKNKQALAQNNQDIIRPQESQIFSSVLSESLSSIPLFFGMSDDNKRIVQAIASTHTNRAAERSSLWLALTHKMTASITETLKDATTNEFGLYCYQAKSSDEWTISTDLELRSPADKALFINLALAHQHHLFFQCSITPLATNALSQEHDLAKQLNEFRPHSPHKVKKLKEVLQNLFAVAELQDVTDVIKAAY
jgi:hypothetical protein